MKHSVFWKIIVGLLFFTSVAEAGLLILLYSLTYNHALEDATSHIQSAASSAAIAFEAYDPNSYEDYDDSDRYLMEMCEGLDITYLYIVKPDVENRNETYLSTGWGNNASDEFKYNRYNGYVAKGQLHDEQIRAFQGEEKVMLHEANQYDDTLICYTPVKKYYSLKTHTFVNKIESIVCAEISLTSIMQGINRRFFHIALLIALTTFLFLGVTGGVLYFRVSKPLRLISRRMKGFVSRKDEFFEKLPVKGRDEIAEMSDSFNTMAEEIDDFITRLSEMNRQKAEMSIAHTIQRGLLEDQDFCNDDVSVKATMLTAKDVGGDLYDYHVPENGKVFVAIADVSGKGVTAALFMARAITLLHQYAKLGYSPGEILHEFNNQLAEHNPKKMFITAFIAVYDPKTSELTYSNAGHNPPYIISDKLTTLNEKGGAAAGIFKDLTYSEYTVKMKPNDKLFLFTDGVTEALDKEGRFFEEERLEEVLCRQTKADAQGTVSAVLDAVKGFANGAEQADDITVLALQIAPDKEERK